MSEVDEEVIFFTWTIKNYFLCVVKNEEFLGSKLFEKENSFFKTCYIRLFSKGTDGSGHVAFQYMFWRKCGPTLTIDFKIELCNAKEKVLASVEKTAVEINDCDYFIRDIIATKELEKKLKDSSSDSLIVKGCMSKQTTTGVSSITNYRIVTEILFNVFSFIWDSDSIDNLATKTFPINDEMSLCITIKELEDHWFFEIKPVIKTKFTLLQVKCEIAYLDEEGIEKGSIFEFFTFEKEDSVWEIPSFSGDSLLECDEIDLKFNFSISNGEYFNKRPDDANDPNLSAMISKNLSAISNLSDDLRSMFLNKEQADVNFRIGSEIISAHKFILASRSPVFSAMFKQKMVENETGVIDITDMDVQTLKLFIEFIYTGEIEVLDWNIALDLLLAAEKYQVSSLKEVCSEFLKNGLTADNVCDLVSVADMVEHQILKTAAMEYIKENSTEILGSQNWLKLVRNNAELGSKIVLLLSEHLKTASKN